MVRENHGSKISPHSDKDVTWGDHYEKLCCIVGFLLKLALGASMILCMAVGFFHILEWIGDRTCTLL